MFPPTKRLSYFDHQFLRVDDFTDEQAYHLGMRRAHNRMLHTPGVAQGLVVGRAGTAVTVSAGAAIDGQGREIVLASDAELPISPDLAGKTAYVTIAYGERGTDETAETGAVGHRRWEEVPSLDLKPAAPGDPETRLVLGRVTIDTAGTVAKIEDGEGVARRRAAGPAPGAELQARSLVVQEGAQVRGTLSAGSLAAAGTLTAAGALTVGGTLSAAGAVTVGGTLSAAGSVAVGGVTSPDATLHVAGGRSVATTDGDLKVGTGGNQLKVAVVVSGAAAGEARLRAEGAAPRLILGAAGADVLTVSGTGVGVGTAPAAGAALTVGGVLNATELRQNNVPVVSSRWSAVTGGIAYTGGRVGIGVAEPSHKLHLRGPDPVALLESTGSEAYVQLQTAEGINNRVEFCNRPGGHAAIFVVGAGDALRVRKDGEVQVPGKLTVGGSVQVTGRVSDARIRDEAVQTNIISITNTNNNVVWHNVPGMRLTLTAPEGGRFLVRFQMGAIQTNGVKDAHAEFQILVNDIRQAYTMEEYHNNGMELRGVTMERLLNLSGPHTIQVQWSVRSALASQTTQVSLWGCHYSAYRTLTVIEV